MQELFAHKRVNVREKLRNFWDRSRNTDNPSVALHFGMLGFLLGGEFTRDRFCFDGYRSPPIAEGEIRPAGRKLALAIHRRIDELNLAA